MRGVLLTANMVTLCRRQPQHTIHPNALERLARVCPADVVAVREVGYAGCRRAIM